MNILILCSLFTIFFAACALALVRRVRLSFNMVVILLCVCVSAVFSFFSYGSFIHFFCTQLIARSMLNMSELIEAEKQCDNNRSEKSKTL